MRKILILLACAAFAVGMTRSITTRFVERELKRMSQPTAIRTLMEVESWKLALYNETVSAGLTYRDFALLREIIRCESSWQQFRKDGSAVVSSGNIGLGQINKTAHEKTYRAMGLDMTKPYDNLKFTVWLYKTQGVKPWLKWSGRCWSKKVQ